MVGSITVGEVRSTGHEVEVNEHMGLSLVIPLKGRILSMSGDNTNRAHANHGALLFSPNRRTTRVVAPKGGEFLGLPLVIPFNEIAGTAERMGISLHQIRHARSFGFELHQQSQPISAELVALCKTLHSEIIRGSRRLNLPGAHAQWGNTLSEKVVEIMHEAGIFDLPDIAWQSTNGRHVDRAMEYMRAHLSDIVLISEVADACGVSNRTLEQAFKHAMNMTPMRALNRFRLQAARAMFLDTKFDATVTDVALACGFRHLSRFSRAYADCFGELPSETRARR
jgi:AraC-like DNA-binding protein